MSKLIPIERIQDKIHLIRGHKVMFDRDLAELYGVKSIVLRQQVKRNIERFPSDFIFRLTKNEVDTMVSQNVIPSKKYLGGSMPYVFTEQGVSMLSSVLRSKKAIQVNIAIMRTFVKIKQMILTPKGLQIKIEQMERKYDKQFKIVFEAIKLLIEESNKQRKKLESPRRRKRKIGF